MKNSPAFFGSQLLLMLALLLGYYSCDAKTTDSSAYFTLVASTPGDEQIKGLLGIAPASKVDFIRWNLVLVDSKQNGQTFILNLHYGESKPNTLGFIHDGEKKLIEGQYRIARNNTPLHGETYHLTSPDFPTEIAILKLSNNLFHLLTPQHQLMVGNGGWSYTLNRKEPLADASTDLPASAVVPNLPDDTALQIIFEGRTPCLDFATEKNLAVAPDCFKLKWKLVLHKDPKTSEPSGYTLYRTNTRESAITGNWIIKKRLTTTSAAVIYQLDPDKPRQTISLLLADRNVAFLLHENNQFFIGNENFSYTLNRRVNIY